ncbi:guanylate kinase isoform X1 [Diachasma alloeum]|uniref:guanylate kinase isoform X1 n=2 Tax=Diachasma alloeum TaxID=454923 RepID=UPI0007384E2B|nr:guanylate kinase isoform X1 [Diachasma alloeum]
MTFQWSHSLARATRQMVYTRDFRGLRLAFSTMLHKGPRPLVLCGPSGSGKSTLIKRMFEEFPDTFGFSISHTTRQPRPGEEHGKHYYFTTKEKMQDQVDRGEFIESAIFSNNMYGTSKKAVEDVMDAGKICVLDIDTQGVKQIKNTSLNPLLVFIKPPSIEELEKRLLARKTETPESLKRRLDVAAEEIKFGEEPGNFHRIITNDDVDKAFAQLREFILDEVNRSGKNGS